ncbi:MAG: hypothetical protein AAB345_00785 [Patescibacteria group bacterium]
MLYKILNKFVEKKIAKIRPIAVKFLNDNMDEYSKKGSLERLEVDAQYSRLITYFADDQKRRHMINRNYINFLHAIVYLYSTSGSAIILGQLTAPAEIYHVINSVKKSFDETIRVFNIK